MGSLGRRLREVFPRKRLSLIALIGFADADIREHCLTGDFDAFLVKPGEIDKLAQPRMSSDHLRRFSKRSVSISVDSADARRRTVLAPAPPCCSTFMRVKQQSICVRTASHTLRNPGSTPSFTGTRACTSLLWEVVDRLVRWWDLVCVSTRGGNQFPNVLLQCRQRFRRPLYIGLARFVTDAPTLAG